MCWTWGRRGMVWRKGALEVLNQHLREKHWGVVCVKWRKFNLVLMFWEVREARGCRKQEDRSVSLTRARQKTWFIWFNKEIWDLINYCVNFCVSFSLTCCSSILILGCSLSTRQWCWNCFHLERYAQNLELKNIHVMIFESVFIGK